MATDKKPLDKKPLELDDDDLAKAAGGHDQRSEIAAVSTDVPPKNTDRTSETLTLNFAKIDVDYKTR